MMLTATLINKALSKKKKKNLPLLPAPPRPEEEKEEETPKPTESRNSSTTSTARSDDPDLENAKLAVMESSDVAKEIDEVDPYFRVRADEWLFYKTKLTLNFVLDFFALTKDQRLKLTKLRFVKCTFQEGAFSALVQLLSLDKRAPLVDIVFDGYFHETERGIITGPVLPFYELCLALERSDYPIKRVSFQRTFLTRKKMLLLFQSLKKRNTIIKDSVILTIHFEMENLIDREHNVYKELLYLISNVRWNQEEHGNSDVPHEEIEFENGQIESYTLKDYNTGTFYGVKYKTLVRLSKVDVEISFDYYADEALKLPMLASSYTQSRFIEKMNDLVKELHEKNNNNKVQKNDAGMIIVT